MGHFHLENDVLTRQQSFLFLHRIFLRRTGLWRKVSIWLLRWLCHKSRQTTGLFNIKPTQSIDLTIPASKTGTQMQSFYFLYIFTNFASRLPSTVCQPYTTSSAKASVSRSYKVLETIDRCVKGFSYWSTWIYHMILWWLPLKLKHNIWCNYTPLNLATG